MSLLSELPEERMDPIYFTTRGEGLPVVFIHGFCETSEIWNPFINKVSTGFQVLTLDLPGFGESKLPNPNISIESIGSIINSWLQDQRLENSIVIGHSLGGYVALSMMAQKPRGFSGLALFHSTAMADNEEKRDNRNRVIEFVKIHGVSAYIDSFVRGLFHNKDHPSIESVKKIALKTSELTFLAYTEAMRDRPEIIKVLDGNHVPVLLLAGQNDAVIPLETLTEQAKLGDSITLHSMADVGHMGMFEAPEESASVVNDFLSAIKRTVVP